MIPGDVRAVITGAAGGIGGHFVFRLASLGASVVAGDIDSTGLEKLRERTASLPGAVLVETLDVSQESSVERFVASAAESLDGINTLVNCAGILKDGLLASREDAWINKLPLEQWKHVIDTNLTGAYLMAREVAASMFQREESGVIVNISSLARSGNAGQTGYSASKAGLDSLTRTWALELAPMIRVGAIAPGLIQTPMLDHLTEHRKTELLNRIPLGQAGTPEDIWLALKFILECNYFTGRIIEIDGGLVL
jgi:3-oxoacyl-[acyl-carrier protein] reductase